MKITFVSNYLNHHQLPFCLEMMKNNNIDFKFISTEKIGEERIKLGYEDMDSKYNFVIKAYDKNTDVSKRILDSDIVIIGGARDEYIKERLKEKKLTFRYSERIYKKGFNFKTWLSVIKNYTFKERKVYLLCSSAYAAYDYNISFAYHKRTFKWGYFPEVIKYDFNNLMDKKKNEKTNILWVGRFLDWKHPEKAVLVAKRLVQNGHNFVLNMIGIGEEYENIKKMIQDNNLEKYVKLLGSMNNKEVRKYMEHTNIFLFTSDYNEGWGAVLNEAMNSGCAIVASHSIGSVPFLLKNNFSGLIYQNEDLEDLYCKVEKLINNNDLQRKYASNAYDTLSNNWNAKKVANNFLKLIEIINNKKENDINVNEPCSIALDISNKKMYKYLMENNYDKESN